MISVSMVRQKLILACILILGMILPFLVSWVIVEVTYLMIPLIMSCFASVSLLIYYLVWDRARLRKSLRFLLVIPAFIAAQFISAWVVTSLQRYRCEYAIEEIEKTISQTGKIPDGYTMTFGIQFVRSAREEEFTLSYSCGFLVTQRYYSKSKAWKRLGWHD